MITKQFLTPFNPLPTLTAAAAALALIACSSPSSQTRTQISSTTGEVVVVEGDVHCVTLFGGQTIDTGEVCVSVDGDNLLVEYNNTDGWELNETHVWVGEDLADMPQTRNGNPRLGNFPYLSGDITGSTSYTETVPLSTLGGEPYVCGRLFYVVAHSAMRRDNGDGTYQTETGYGDGTLVVERGSWATFFPVALTCPTEEPDPDPHPQNCETAFAEGETTLDSLPDPLDPSQSLTDRWGWQLGPISGNTSGTVDVHAGAAQNDTSKGIKVGTLDYQYTISNCGYSCYVRATYNADPDYVFTETHLYVGFDNVDTAAPGQFGNIHDLSQEGVSSDTFVVYLPSCGEDVYLVAHAVACDGGTLADSCGSGGSH